ncbi:MAG: SRPBCC domain-containing protein [Candidatus Dormiibacterota bacterium]
MPEVVRSVDIQAPPSAVWKWFASQESLRRWLGSELEIDLRVGGAYQLLGPDKETWIRGSVLELIPEGRLVLSWMEQGGDWVYPSRLVISLAATSTGTQVTLLHDGFAGIGKSGWPGTLDAYELGADRHRVLEQLAELVTTGGA